MPLRPGLAELLLLRIWLLRHVWHLWWLLIPSLSEGASDRGNRRSGSPWLPGCRPYGWCCSNAATAKHMFI